MLLSDAARKRVELAARSRGHQPIVAALDEAGAAAEIDRGTRAAKLRDTVAEELIKNLKGGRKPDFAILIPRRPQGPRRSPAPASTRRSSATPSPAGR